MTDYFSKVANENAIQTLHAQTFILQNESDLHYIQMNLTDFIENKAVKRDLNRVKIVSSELSTNILKYAKRGKIIISLVKNNDLNGIKIEAVDRGPGILDLEKAMQDNYSTGKSLGLGLPGIKRLSDDFHITSEVDIGTHITSLIWLNK